MSPEELRSLLADSPNLEEGLAAIREVDRTEETWTFDDVPVDSGVFGELVGEGVVESVGEEYRLADPDAVDRVLDGGADGDRDDKGRSGIAFDRDIEFGLPAIDRAAAGVLVLLLALTALVRASNFTRVLRDRVVYGGNDPYAYVYWVERGLEAGWTLSSLPGGLSNQEPLTIVQLLYGAELAGGLGEYGAVLAWAPVVAAVATAAALYGFAFEVSMDRRLALTSVFVFAIMPVHTLRSALGFVDHHAFDFLWLVVAAWGLARTMGIETLEPRPRTAVSVAILGVGVGGGVLAWWAGTLLLLPIVVAAVLAGTTSIRDDRSFIPPGLATAAGVGVGAAIVAFTHVQWGWHDILIVGVPIVLTAGVAGLVAAAALWHRLSLPAWAFPATGIIGTIGVGAVVRRLRPEEWARIAEQLSGLFAEREIVEVQSIFDAATMGWLFSFGLIFFVVLPAMAWGLYRAVNGDRRWSVASSYAWVLLALAAVQSRYAGEFSPFAAFFGGVAVLYAAAWIDGAAPTIPFGGEDRPLSLPDRSVAVRFVGIVVLICGLSAVMAPIAANNVAIPDEQYETAVFLDEHAADHGYEYPESYVFSPWSWNRMYNYHVNGESGSYGYAQSRYREFTAEQEPRSAYEQIRGGRADGAYLVTEPIPDDIDVPAAAMQSRLHDRLGSRGDGVDGLGRYRSIYVSDSGDYKAFRVVSGAVLRGDAEPGASVRFSRPIEIDGAEFTYERAVTAANGTFAVRVPYPGAYAIEGGGVTESSVSVSESAVVNGEEVRVGNRSGG